ncbi:hypothetical protein SAY86_002873 [Trapa natans]|uniref:NADH:ubiquinone reductase (non-electrogenic) n=1 Tax=Trapa natans TaxID=22666 RepID=A0AAN7QZZ2_TRANT|nr:hypothetical protein SAY86_002873 [Trapa natans]
MKTFTLSETFSKAFHDYPNLSKLVILFTISGRGLVSYFDANPISSSQIIFPIEVENKKKRVVNLKNPEYGVQVVSPRNYFAFPLLLPSVTCGTVEAPSIVEPIRNIIRKKNMDTRYRKAEYFKIDAKNKRIYCRSNKPSNLNGKQKFVVEYDYLIVAMGARSNTFNIPGVEENYKFLKEVEDAQEIRRSVIDCFEKASLPNLSEEERKRILHFVIIGGGPTGVEFSIELHEFVNEDMGKLNPGVKELVKITLLEARDHILGMFDKRITEFAEKKIQNRGN